jgi:hypothetical protein
MYDEQKSREPEIAPELASLERQLRGIAPTAPRVDRDRLMFAAGQAAATAGTGQDGRAVDDGAGRRLHIAGASWVARRFWPAATFTMTAATLLLTTMLVWQRQTNQIALQSYAAPPSINLVSEQPREKIPPSPGQSTTSSFGSLAFQRPSSGDLGIRYVALMRGMSAWESSSQASIDDADSSNDPAPTQRKMLEELLPPSRHQMNPRS